MAAKTSLVNRVYPAPDYSGFPDLYLKVAFVGDESDIPDYAQWLIRCSCTLVSDITEADMVIFGGGADVDPQLYGQKPHPTTHIDPGRDTDEMMFYEEARLLGIPILGICRGMQFAHVMEGGKLYQDVDNHNDGHHKMYCPITKDFFNVVSSVHHQAVQPREDDRMQVIGQSWASTYRQKTHLDRVNARAKVGGKTEPDIEAVFYRDALVLGIQGHPEYPGFDDYSRWAARTIDHYFSCNPDTEYRGGVLRKKEDLIVPLPPVSKSDSSAKKEK